jgi:hypothetical protein
MYLHPNSIHPVRSGPMPSLVDPVVTGTDEAALQGAVTDSVDGAPSVSEYRDAIELTRLEIICFGPTSHSRRV